jgi:putative oxidoreductase
MPQSISARLIRNLDDGFGEGDLNSAPWGAVPRYFTQNSNTGDLIMTTAPNSDFRDASTASASSLAKSAIAALAGRILIAPIFLLSGVSKVTAPAMMIGYIKSVGLPAPMLALGIAIAVELLGGVALLLGYRARLVAAILAVFSIVTALAFHNNLADQMQFLNFFKNFAMAGGLLQIVAFGAGRFSLDARRG